MLTIGIPVYNAEKYLRETFDSIINQTYKEFKVIISDNASTDGTREICEDYIKKDSRFHYTRHKNNIGAPGNWNYLARNIQTKYFKWASGNDLIEKTMVDKCISIMENDDDIVLCYPKTNLIDEKGDVLEKFEDNLHFMNIDPKVRFKELLTKLKLNNSQNGIIRSSALKRTKLEGLYIGGDIPFLAELSLYGKYYEYPEYLFSRRTSDDASTINKSLDTLGNFYSPSKKTKSYQRGHFYFDISSRLFRSNLKILDKLSLYFFVVKLMYWDSNTRY